jgi:hypothetical protein
MDRILNAENIDSEIRAYLNQVESLNIISLNGSNLEILHRLKREQLRSGPYPGVSLFEAANRIFSDLVILYGVKLLLAKRKIGRINIPFREYRILLGVEGGNDILADSDGRRLIGEAFNVSPSFFQQKKSNMIKKLRMVEKASYRVIMFNDDAVKNPQNYIEKSSENDVIYVPVRINDATRAGLAL